MSVIALSGNPRRDSRTAAFAHAAAATIGTGLGIEKVALVDLAEPDVDHDDARATLAAATVAVVASPTYKATYTGLLKSVLDGLAPGSLGGVIAIPLMVQAGGSHTLAADVHLRPVLLELGATCPTSAIVALESEVARPADVLDTWFMRSAWALRALAGAREHNQPEVPVS